MKERIYNCITVRVCRCVCVCVCVYVSAALDVHFVCDQYNVIYV